MEYKITPGQLEACQQPGTPNNKNTLMVKPI